MTLGSWKRFGTDGAAGGSIGGRVSMLGDFELRQEIGRGGMGTVFEAWQKSLNRTVAIKVLAHQISASPHAIKRFQREAQAAAKLHHMHITPIFAQGQDRGVYYYAMELVDGPSLAGVLFTAREGGEAVPVRVPAAETVVLLRGAGHDQADITSAPSVEESREDARRQLNGELSRTVGRPRALDQFAAVARHVASIADALDYAHRQGVVHRDIKPHNLLFGSDGHLRITDFGLARLSAEPGVTMTGEMVGSPLYMSPEQITEDRETIDHRTDIYSLGATLYEWLTGRPPFPGETRERVISQITNSDAIQPRSLCHEIPLALETICLKALERDRRRRYQTAGELRDDLHRFLDSQPIRARRASLSMRLQRFAARHPVAVLAAAAIMVAASLSLALFRKQTEIATKTQSLEEATAQAVQAKQDFDRWITSAPLMVDGMPPEIGGTFRMAEKVLPTVQNLLAGAGSVADPTKASPDSAASESLRTPHGLARRASQDFFASISRDVEPAKDEFGKLLNLAREKRESEPAVALKNVESYLAVKPDDYEARLLGVALYASVGDYDAMEAGAEALLALRKNDSVGFFWRGMARFLRGEADPSLTDLALAGQSKPLAPWAQTVRALLFLQIGRPVEAIEFLDEAVSRSPDLLVALLARAVAHGAVYLQTGESANVKKAVADLSDVIAKEPKNIEALTMRGEYYGSLAEFASAAADFDSAIDLGASNTLLNAKWMWAKFAQAKKEQLLNATGPATTTELKTDSTEAPPPGDITTQSMQQWFSRFVYPGGGNAAESGLGTSEGVSPTPLAPAPQTPPRPGSVKVGTTPDSPEKDDAERAGSRGSGAQGTSANSQQSLPTLDAPAEAPDQDSGAPRQPSGTTGFP